MDSKINFLKSKIFFIPNLILNIAFFPVRLFFSKYVKKNDNLRKNQELQQEEKDNFEYYFNSDISIELKFDKACEFLKSFTSLTNEQQLDFYALFKQSKEGNCTKSKPNIFDIVETKKWEAWKSKEGMQSKEAMTLYIKKIKDLEASFKKTEDDEDIWMDENDNENINNEKRGFGIKMSRLAHKEISEERFIIKNSQNIEIIEQFFNLVMEEKVEEINKILQSRNYNLDNKNSAGATAIHFAIDNEKINSFSTLLPYYSKFNIDIPDATGMTPFHYALMIDNIYIMTALLKNKPDLLVKDCNGESAISLATSKQREIINKYIKL